MFRSRLDQFETTRAFILSIVEALVPHYPVIHSTSSTAIPTLTHPGSTCQDKLDKEITQLIHRYWMYCIDFFFCALLHHCSDACLGRCSDVSLGFSEGWVWRYPKLVASRKASMQVLICCRRSGLFIRYTVLCAHCDALESKLVNKGVRYT